MPSSSHRSSSGWLERNAGEYWFCTDASRPPRTSFAVRIWSGSAFEMPAMRMTPSSRSSASAPTESAYGTAGSGRWNWYSPIASTPSRAAEAFAASLRYSGRPSCAHGPASGRRCPPLVAMSTASVSPWNSRTAFAIRSSLWPTSSWPAWW